MTTEQTQPAYSSRRSILLDFLGSMNLAITILVIVAIASVIGTVLQQNQSYSDYIFKYGPFWHEYFRFLHLYDVYGSMWFLLLLVFLVISTSVCIYRNAPVMLQEMRNFRLNSQLKSLNTMENARSWPVNPAPALLDRVRRFLSVNGYRVREKQHEDRLVIAGMRGGFNRIGYILAHLGIVVICLGAFLNAKFDLRLREWFGKLSPLPNNVMVQSIEDYPRKSTLRPGQSFAFRGSTPIPEGQNANYTLLNIRDGTVVQYLPFSIELKQFRVEQYKTGQPKSFESDLVIHDRRLKQPLHATIAVNHPLSYRGYHIYQASFGDGGSHLQLKLWPFYDAHLKTLNLKGTVHEQSVIDTMQGPLTLEFANFKKFNVFPVTGKEAKHHKFKNYGSSIVFRLRNKQGEAREFINYMSPIELDGRYFYLSGMRDSVSQDYRYLHIPADDQYSLKRFMDFEAALVDAPRVMRIAKETMGSMMASESVPADVNTKVLNSMVDLVDSFMHGGDAAIDAQIRRRAQDPEQQRKLANSYAQVISSLMQAVYIDVLKQQGLKPEQNLTSAQKRFYYDAVAALGQIYAYGSPFYVQLTDFKQVQQSVLQVTRSPGNWVLILGCLMLIAGVFLLFYVNHQRLWLVLYKDESGTDRLLFAGSGNRNTRDFRIHYQALAERLDNLLKT